METNRFDELIEALRERRKTLEGQMEREMRKFQADIHSLKRAEYILTQSETQPVSSEETQISDEFRKLSITESILRLLESNSTMEYRATELAKEVRQRGLQSASDNFLNVVTATANRLVKKEKIQRQKKRFGKKEVWVYKRKGDRLF